MAKNFSVQAIDTNNYYFDLNGSASVSVEPGKNVWMVNDSYQFSFSDSYAIKFSTELGGEYVFTGNKASVVGVFDASGAKDVIRLTSVPSALADIKTGAGNDVVTTSVAGSIKTGEGNDTVTVTDGDNVSVTLGDGKDTLIVNGGKVTVMDYSFAEGDKISVGNFTGFVPASVHVADDGKFSVGGTSVTGSLKSEGGVAELMVNDKHYAFATGNVSEYVAKDEVLFKVASTDVEVLNFTSGKLGSSVDATAMKKDTTLNFVSGYGDDSIVAGNTNVNYGITKNSGNDKFDKVFTTDDTLMIKDGIATGLKITADDALTYGKTSVSGVLAADATGSFKVQNNGADDAFLMAYTTDNTKAISFNSDVKFYLATDKSKASVDASDLSEANINMNGNGVDYAVFDSNIVALKTAQSGYVVGRNNVATSIDASEGAGRLDIYGGAGAKGNDTIVLGASNTSTDVIYYSLGDGNDTVTGFDAESDVVFFYNATANYKDLASVIKVNGVTDTSVVFDKKTNALTLKGNYQGKTLVFADQNMAEAMKVAIGKNNVVEFATDTKVYTNATTLNVNTGNTGDVLAINLTAQSDAYGYYSTDIVEINAAGSNATTYLVGANKANSKVIGGTGTNYIYGGGNKNQELVGNAAAVDVIYFGTGDGKDNVTSINADDGVLLYNVADINSVKVTADSSQTVVSLGSDKLTLNGLTETDLATFTFADQNGALYTYNTTDKKFVQKA